MTQIIGLSLILIHFNLIMLRVVVDKNCVHVYYYLERSGNFLPKFRDNQKLNPQRSRNLYIWPMKIGHNTWR